MRIKKFAVPAFMCLVMAAVYAFAQDGAAAQPAPAQPAAAQQPAAQPAPAQPAPAPAGSAEEAVIANIPATSYWGVRGLSQTVSAEPLGEGRVTVAVFGSYFRQNHDYDIYHVEPSYKTGVGAGRLAGAWGISNFIDVFALFPMVVYKEEMVFNIGGLVGGGQFSLAPVLPENFPLKIAAQAYFIYGLAKDNKVTLNPHYVYGDEPTLNQDGTYGDYDSYAGYDFFDARGTFDVAAKLIQSLVLKGQGSRGVAVKLHANEGISFTTGSGWDALLLLAAGIQLDPVEFLTIGIELNSRTRISEPTNNDPFWLTPSIMYRSPWCFGALAGIDINWSGNKAADGKDKLTKPLEAWRVFGDLVFSYDFLASKRAADARRAKDEAAKKAQLEADKEYLAQKNVDDSVRAAEEMARRAEADSIRAKAVADSLANLMDAISQKARQDSMAMAERESKILADAEAKRVADSLALAETQKNLAAEKAKRSEAEQYLLTTGMLVLEAVYFTSGKADLHINSRPYLGTIAKMLVKYPKLKLEIGGHTDNIGRFETNMNLSQKRAESVFLYMISVEPSLAQMLTSRGYGSTVPKADNKTAGGREINRRVELKVLNPEVLKDYR